MTLKITDHQIKWIRAVDAMHTELRRPPLIPEVKRALGIKGHGSKSGYTLVLRLVELGYLVKGPGKCTTPRPIRVTPAARMALGMPMTVYLAFPLGDGMRAEHDDAARHGQAAAFELLQRYGLFCSSPLLTPGAAGRPGSMDAATATATALHAVVVWRDPLLVGRQDVDTARRAGVLVTVAGTGPMPASVDALWLPPMLVPSLDREGENREVSVR